MNTSQSLHELARLKMLIDKYSGPIGLPVAWGCSNDEILSHNGFLIWDEENKDHPLTMLPSSSPEHKYPALASGWFASNLKFLHDNGIMKFRWKLYHEYD